VDFPLPDPPEKMTFIGGIAAKVKYFNRYKFFII